MQKSRYLVIWGLLFVLFFLGGVGMKYIYIHYFGCAIGFIILLLFARTGIKIRFPDHFLLYGLFLAFCVISIFWSENKFVSYEFLLLFVSGGVVWIIFYNLTGLFDKTQKQFLKLVFVLGVVYVLLFISGISIQITEKREVSLYLYATQGRNHHHLGDYWAPLLLISVVLIIVKRKLWGLLGILLGSITLFVSYSRSAVLSLLAGFIFIVSHSLQTIRIPRGYIYISLVVLFTIIIFWTSNKSLIFNRPYYLQLILGIVNHPFGLGLGNFVFISYPLRDVGFQLSSYSFFVHNLILEVISGVGIFSVLFIMWFIKIHSSVIKNLTKKNINIALLFIVYSVNFMFDITYFSPTMLWIWFASLGLVQAERKP